MPRYSIVIPTRNGAETLHSTLRTVLAVEYDDYEVVVCDNDTSDATRKLVDEIAAPRIRYIKAPRPLAMSSNWELAVSEARGDYVTVLGDDDALLPQSLRELDELLTITEARVIRWDPAFYVWPTVDLPGQAHYLRVPTGRTAARLDGAAAIRDVINFDRCYSSLPMIYNAIVERRLLDEIRGAAGRIFLNRISDVASGIAVAHVAGQFVSVSRPMSVAGVSHKSTGLGTLFRRTSYGDDWHTLNAAEQLQGAATLPDVYVFPTIPVAEAFLAVQARLFPQSADYQLDRRRVLANCLNSLRTSSRDEWDAALKCIRASIADDEQLLLRFDAQVASLTPQTSGPLPFRQRPAGAEGEVLHLDADRFGVVDVSGAARLCAQVLGASPAADEAGWQVVDGEPADERRPPAAAGNEALHDELISKEVSLLSKEVSLQQAITEGRRADAMARDLSQQLQQKHQKLHEALEATEELRKRFLKLHAMVDELQVTTSTQSHQLARLGQIEQVAAERAAVIERQRCSLAQAHADLARVHANLLEKHQALECAQSLSADLNRQLLEKHAALHQALEQVAALRGRSLWRRVRSAA